MYDFHPDAFNEAAGKSKQMLPGGSKERSAQQHGYFTEKYGRVFEGESYSDPIKIRRRYRLEETKKNLSKPFLPASGEKKAWVQIFFEVFMAFKKTQLVD